MKDDADSEVNAVGNEVVEEVEAPTKPTEDTAVLSYADIGGALLAILDCTLCLGVVAPLVVLYWWSTWTLSDYYIFPESFLTTTWISVGWGVPGLLITALLQHVFDGLVKDKGHVVRLVANNIHTVLFAVIQVQQWRGIWYLWDHYHGTSIWSALLSILSSIVLMVLFRAFKTIKAPPMILAVDLNPESFLFPTRFNCKWKVSRVRFILDCVWSAVVIHGLIVFYWRGVFTLMGHIFYPDDKHKQAVYGLVLGCCTSAVCYVIQYPVHITVTALRERKYPALLAIIVEDGFSFINNASCVFVWKALWDTYTLYLLPGLVPGRWWIACIASQIALMLLLVGKSIVVVGVIIDGDGDALLSLEYVRFFLKRKVFRNYDSK